MKRPVLLMILSFLFFITPAYAANFDVTPDSDTGCYDFECSFQSALTEAANNGEDDTIILSEGVYSIYETLAYYPMSDNSSITITGAGKDLTIIDGEEGVLIFDINTTGLGDDSQIVITLTDLTVQNESNQDTSNDDFSFIIHSIDADIVFRDIDVSKISNGDFLLDTGGTITITSSSDIEIPDVTIITGTGSLLLGADTSDIILNGEIYSDSIDISAATVVIDLTEQSDTDITFNTVPLTGIDAATTSGTITLADESITVIEGSTITLDSYSLFDNTNSISSYRWNITAGPDVVLSDPTAAQPTFVTGVIDIDRSPSSGNTFSVTATYDNGNIETRNVEITVNDNGCGSLTEFSSVAIFAASTERIMEVKETIGGILVQLLPIDPETINNNNGKPTDMIYGLIDITLIVDNPGDTATITYTLDDPAPSGYTWFKYDSINGWYDFSDYAVFNEERDQVTLTLVDGGIGDDDGLANGEIIDPSGLGVVAYSGASGEDGGKCFIATAAYGSLMEPHVKILCNFRDNFLLTNTLGKAFVTLYYKHSPQIANRIAGKDKLRAIVRCALLPVVCVSWVVLTWGIFPTLISILVTMIITYFTVIFLLRKKLII